MNSVHTLFDPRVLELLAKGRKTNDWDPISNFYDEEDRYLLVLELPGIPQEQLSITLDKHILKVSGTKESGVCTGKFETSHRVPKDSHLSGVKAVLKDGVLTISIPKVEDSKPRQIPIAIPPAGQSK